MWNHSPSSVLSYHLPLTPPYMDRACWTAIRYVSILTLYCNTRIKSSMIGPIHLFSFLLHYFLEASKFFLSSGRKKVLCWDNSVKYTHSLYIFCIAFSGIYSFPDFFSRACTSFRLIWALRQHTPAMRNRRFGRCLMWKWLPMEERAPVSGQIWLKRVRWGGWDAIRRAFMRDYLVLRVDWNRRRQTHLPARIPIDWARLRQLYFAQLSGFLPAWNALLLRIPRPQMGRNKNPVSLLRFRITLHCRVRVYLLIAFCCSTWWP